MNLLYYIEGYKSCMNDTLDYLEVCICLKIHEIIHIVKNSVHFLFLGVSRASKYFVVFDHLIIAL